MNMAHFPVIYTTGVYGCTEKEFFERLIKNNIDCFCDIRRRRAVRGPEYSFVNSQRLQDRLALLSIQYLYEPGLAPTTEIMNIQKGFDEKNKVPRRKRETLSETFKTAYIKQILSQFNMKELFARFETLNKKNIVFFCVEKFAEACHRSLVTHKIQELYPKIKVINL